MQSIDCSVLKTKSSSKSDLTITPHDKTHQKDVELGFSIKSRLGEPATLFNASRSSNFVYKVVGLTGTAIELEEINAITSKSKIRDRVKRIQEKGGVLEYFGIDNSVFENNLVLIDSLLPNILSEIIKLYLTTNIKRIDELIKETSINNPMKYNLTHLHEFYEYKMKRCLRDIALGMTSSEVWQGVCDATDEHFVVNEGGSVLSYYIYNKDAFEDYLYHNTYLDIPGSGRHGYGILYKERGDLFFKLNVQIRFV